MQAMHVNDIFHEGAPTLVQHMWKKGEDTIELKLKLKNKYDTFLKK